jgi:hypothetical protein
MDARGCVTLICLGLVGCTGQKSTTILVETLFSACGNSPCTLFVADTGPGLDEQNSGLVADLRYPLLRFVVESWEGDEIAPGCGIPTEAMGIHINGAPGQPMWALTDECSMGFYGNGQPRHPAPKTEGTALAIERRTLLPDRTVELSDESATVRCTFDGADMNVEIVRVERPTRDEVHLVFNRPSAISLVAPFRVDADMAAAGLCARRPVFTENADGVWVLDVSTGAGDVGIADEDGTGFPLYVHTILNIRPAELQGVSACAAVVERAFATPAVGYSGPPEWVENPYSVQPVFNPQARSID